MTDHFVHDTKNFVVGSVDEEVKGPFGVVMESPNNWLYPFGYLLEDGREIIPEEYSFSVPWKFTNGGLQRSRPVVVGKVTENADGNADVYVEGTRVRRRGEDVVEHGGYLWFPRYYTSSERGDIVLDALTLGAYKELKK